MAWEQDTFLLCVSALWACWLQGRAFSLAPSPSPNVATPTLFWGFGGCFLHGLSRAGHHVVSGEQRRISFSNKTNCTVGFHTPQWESLNCQVTHFVFCPNRLVGDILLCTGFLSYLGPFNQIFRNYLLKDQWEIELRARRIPFTENLNLISMLVDPPTVSITLLTIFFEFQSHFMSYEEIRYT